MKMNKGNLGGDDFWWHSYSDISIEHHYHSVRLGKRGNLLSFSFLFRGVNAPHFHLSNLNSG